PRCRCVARSLGLPRLVPGAGSPGHLPRGGARGRAVAGQGKRVSTINFNGVISPSLIMGFQSIKVAGAPATADENYLYWLANRLIFEFVLEVTTPAGVVTVERHATAKNPLYDRARPAYICDPTP